MKKKESIFQLLSQKPWEPSQAKIDNLHEGETLDLTKGKLGLRFIMIVSTIFFCLFIVTYADRMIYPDWQRMPEPLLLWINTFLLLITSLIFVTVQIASKNNNFHRVKKRMIIVGLFSFLFLIGQLLVWQQFINLGYYVATNPAYAYFYVFTTLHGIHLLGGLFYWNINMRKVWMPEKVAVVKTKHSIELCAIYWHFLFIVWIVLFGLMIFS